MNLLCITDTQQPRHVPPRYSVEWHVEEGDELEPIRHIATVCGKAQYLLLDERVTLNLVLARYSRIATACIWAIFLLWSTTHQMWQLQAYQGSG